MTTVVERALTTEKLFPLLRVKYSELGAASAALSVRGDIRI